MIKKMVKLLLHSLKYMLSKKCGKTIKLNFNIPNFLCDNFGFLTEVAKHAGDREYDNFCGEKILG